MASWIYIMSRFLIQKYKSVLKLDPRLLEKRDHMVKSEQPAKQSKFDTPRHSKYETVKKQRDIEDSPIVTLTPVQVKYDKNKLTESYLIKAEPSNQNLRVNQSLKDLAKANEQQGLVGIMAGNTSTECNTPINTPVQMPILAFPGPVDNIMAQFMEVRPVPPLQPIIALPSQPIIALPSPHRKHRIFTHKHQSPIVKKARIFVRPATVNHFIPRTFQYISCPFDYLKDPPKAQASLPFNKQIKFIKLPENIAAKWRTLQ